MGTCASARFIDEIEEEEIKMISPLMFDNLMMVMEETHDDMEDLALAQEAYSFESVSEQTKNAYEDLIISINERTGMNVIIGYHTINDRCDEVDGVYWQVLNRMILNPEIKEFEDKIERKFFVELM